MISEYLQISLRGIITSIIMSCSLLFPGKGHCQDLFDRANTGVYAGYLFSSRQFALAAEEYERLIFMDRNNPDTRLKLIRSYRLAGNNTAGIRRLYMFYGDSILNMPHLLAREFMTLQILSDSLNIAADFSTRSTTLLPHERIVYNGLNAMLMGNYEAASEILNPPSSGPNAGVPAPVIDLSVKASSMRFKSPFLAGTLSAIVPGTGKVYTKNTGDGIIAFLFVAGNAWQAYRGFSQSGVNSAYGWIFSTLSASFYIGNIFGSAKAAKVYNRNRKNEIDKQVYDLVRGSSF